MIHQDQQNQPLQRQIPAVVIGDFKVMYRPDEAYERIRKVLKRQYTSIEETSHFLFVRVPRYAKDYSCSSTITRRAR